MQKTKKSMLAIGLAVLVCVAMLIGTTFAWFTDSVTNKGNKIQAGNLSIGATVASVDSSKNTYQIEGINGGKKFGFGDAVDLNTSTDPIISEEKWEPGQSNAKLLTVTNSGSLAVKIKLDFMVKDGGLTDALWFDFIQVKNNDVIGEFQKRPMNSLEELAQTMEFALGEGESVSFILIYGMYEEAGNEYQGKSFEADVTILARQDTVEQDGFGNPDYDADAEYATVVSDEAGLKDAITSGKPVALAQDITLDERIEMEQGTSMDLGGHKLTLSNVNPKSPTALIVKGADQTLDIKNGEIVCDHNNATMSVVQAADGATVNVENLTFKAEQASGLFVTGNGSTLNVVNSDITVSTFCVATNAGAEYGEQNVTVNLVNSTFSTTNADSCPVLINVPGTLNMTNCTVNGHRQGVMVRGGTAVLTDCTINYDNTFAGDSYLNGTWGEGNEVPKAALVIGNRVDSAYQYAANCTLNNTDIICTNEGRAVYISGNTASKEIGATFTYDEASSVGEIVKGIGHITINGSYENINS